ncbi:hypothetical protein BDW02DRAFT_638609 [Decorospora gaudefroyi]|uniref:Uncharacterized protein n=1 Tax=Decorospora gaudefroyi TaxID=184978 RepID=A0A6A5KBU3_9PLEO|nr:hypothetical protein BDW02DRAFT_638609 [Decorospora gaudefroyi]
MASDIPDRWLWLGLGVFTFIAIQQVSTGLKQVRNLTQIRNPEHMPPRRPAIPSGPPTYKEDGIKTSSLLTLATSHNTDIRNTATHLLCTRFCASKTAKDLLMRDLYSSNDEEVTHRAQLAFNLLCDMGAWTPDDMRPRGSGRSVPGLGQAGGSERDVRRRRREAMVIHDGDGAVGREDVYMRDQAGRMNSEELRLSRGEEWDIAELLGENVVRQ